MVTPNISFFMKFSLNTTPRKYKGVVGERKCKRFDLSETCGFWESFQNLKTKKGEVYLILNKNDRNPHRKHDASNAEYYLQMHPCRLTGEKRTSYSFNLTALRLMLCEEQDYWTCAGEPMITPTLTNGIENPTYANKNDGFVILLDKAEKWLEIWVFEDARVMVDAYAKAVFFNQYQQDMDLIRTNAKRYVIGL